ncbi:hypothetical protein KC853_02420 [Candidatus Saccharibacteria bacterium]|nr:hypothetical protein [Candidatus Saccharibacteria bacterium]
MASLGINLVQLRTRPQLSRGNNDFVVISNTDHWLINQGTDNLVEALVVAELSGYKLIKSNQTFKDTLDKIKLNLDRHLRGFNFEKASLKRRFIAALEQINQQIVVSSEHEFNICLCLVRDQQVLIAEAGNNRIFHTRGDEVAELSEPTNPENIDKFFHDLSEGSLILGDKLIVTTNKLISQFGQTKLLELFDSSSSSELVGKIADQISTNSGGTGSYAGFCFDTIVHADITPTEEIVLEYKTNFLSSAINQPSSILSHIKNGLVGIYDKFKKLITSLPLGKIPELANSAWQSLWQKVFNSYPKPTIIVLIILIILIITRFI